MKRSATAVWKGTGKTGTGTISAASGVFTNASYAWNTRFENEKGTNPEELIAAAHAGCFSMKLSFVLNAAGFTPDPLEPVFASTTTFPVTSPLLTIGAKASKVAVAKQPGLAMNRA